MQVYQEQMKQIIMKQLIKAELEKQYGRHQQMEHIQTQPHGIETTPASCILQDHSLYVGVGGVTRLLLVCLHSFAVTDVAITVLVSVQCS